MEEIGNEDPTIQIPLTVIKELIAEADQLYEKEAHILEAKTSGDKAEDLAEDKCEGKADDSDRDDTDAEDESVDVQTLASVDESFDAQTELKKYILKYKEVILREHKVKSENEPLRTPTSTVKKRKVATTASPGTSPLTRKRKRPSRTPSSTDSNKILKKTKAEDSPERKEIRERVAKAKKKPSKLCKYLARKKKCREAQEGIAGE